MGGDLAPTAAVEGALLALTRDEELTVDLVGREPDILEVLAGREHPRLIVCHAPDVLNPDDPPVRSAKARPKSSIHHCLARVRDGHDQATVTAGDTGALLAAATMVLRRLRGVSRPGIAVPLPRPGGMTVLSDAGANLRPRPVHLLQYGLMAAEFARTHLGVEDPRVGLLSVGTEIRKATDLIKKTNTLLERSPLRYEGIVEGQDIFGGEIDVVVCDGFTGNAILKSCEGLAASLKRHLAEKAGVAGFETDSLDFSSYGGAPLLGVRGVVVIGHGRSGPNAIANGVMAAAEGVRQGLVERLGQAAHSMSRLARAAQFLPSREGGEA